ncbi:SagB family peptide dehydrogenase (plasmid) [Alkalihalobacillus hwajinpoensis]|nr:SagB family peptide dehydrogenase [Pseudalkalibacillus hwajinpoensis]
MVDNIVLFWEGDVLVCDDYVQHKQHTLNPSVIEILDYFKSWKDINEISELRTEEDDDYKEVINTIGYLMNEKILVTNDDQGKPDLSLWKEWGKAAEYFHYYSRGGKNDSYILSTDDFERLKNKTEYQKPPEITKNYPNSLKTSLPLPIVDYKKSFLDVLFNRQTIRTYNPSESINKEELSSALYYVWGAVACWLDQGMGKALLKTSPSGGSRHPIEIYPCIMNVEGVESGLYHYSVENHELELIDKPNDIRSLCKEMCGDQKHTQLPAVVFFYSAVIEREVWKYSVPKAYRALYMDLGHLSQTLYLVASYLQLGCFYTAALRDELVEEKLKLDWTNEVVIGASGIGALTDEVKGQNNLGRFVRNDVNY